MAKKRRTKKQKAATAKMIRANKKRRRSGKKKASKRRRKAARAPVPMTETKPKRRRRRRKAKAAPKRRRRSKRSKRRSSKRKGGRRSVKTVRQRVVSVPKAGTQSVRIDLNPSRGGKKRRRSRRRKNPEVSLARAGNPAGSGLLGNAGPFTKDALMGYVSMAAGVGIGVIGADFADRFVSTMKPKDGNHPWYGRNAAAAYQRRPDALRLGVQAGGAVAAMALTYFARNIKVLPWLTGGLSIGFGVNLFTMLSRWFLMPAILKASDGEIKLGNRLYPMEQAGVQDAVDTFFENYATAPSLSAGQAGTEPTSPPVGGAPIAVYVLGDGQPGQDQVGRARSSRRMIQTGRLGGCASCGGGDGVCYSDCPNMCQDCIAQGDGTATYTVEPGDVYPTMVTTAGVNAAIVSGLNGGKHWQEFWRVGSRVQVPYHFAVYLQGVSKHRAALGNVPAQQPQTAPPIQNVMAPPPAAPASNGETLAPLPSAFALNNDAE